MKLKFLAVFLVAILGAYSTAKPQNKPKAAIHFFIIDADSQLGINADEPFYDSVYSFLEMAIQKESAFDIVPISELKDKIIFSFMDYPASSVKKAVKSNLADSYLKVDIVIGPDGVSSSSSSSLGSGGVSVGKSKIKTKVKVTLNATQYDKNGKKLKKLKEVSVSAEKMEISQESLSLKGFTFTELNNDTKQLDTFDYLIKDVCVKFAKNLK